MLEPSFRHNRRSPGIPRASGTIATIFCVIASALVLFLVLCHSIYAETGWARIYFLNRHTAEPAYELRRVPLTPESVVRELLEGPEDRKSYYFPFPPGTRLVKATHEGRTLTLDFSPEFLETASSPYDKYAATLLGLNLRQIRWVHAYSATVNGEPVPPGGHVDLGTPDPMRYPCSDPPDRPDAMAWTTRVDDSWVSLERRVAFANEKHRQGRCDVFVSVHADAQVDEDTGEQLHDEEGICTRWGDCSPDRDDRELAREVHDKARFARFAHSGGVVDRLVDRGIQHAGSASVLDRVEMPACLVEVGFISNTAHDYPILADPTCREEIACQIYLGFRYYWWPH